MSVFLLETGCKFRAFSFINFNGKNLAAFPFLYPNEIKVVTFNKEIVYTLNLPTSSVAIALDSISVAS